MPMPCDIDPPTHPYFLMFAYMFEKSLQSTTKRRSARQPAMQADIHHLGRLLSLRIEHIECINKVLKIGPAGSEPGSGLELPVITFQRVRHH